LDEFNAAIEKLHASGEYTKIQKESYPNTLHSMVEDLLNQSGLVDSLHVTEPSLLN
jgi:hypothetical protein